MNKRELYYDDPLILPPECDVLCPFRPCYNKYENKGSFTPGVGYTKYSSTFQPVCGTRMTCGCPVWRRRENDKVDVKKACAWILENIDSRKLKVRKRVRDILRELSNANTET